MEGQTFEILFEHFLLKEVNEIIKVLGKDKN